MESQNIPPTKGSPEPTHVFSSRFKDNFSTIGIILLAPVLALFLTAFVFQTYEVDGPSMEKTLSNKDRLIVLKSDRTWSKISRDPYIPNRFDVIVFNLSGEFGSGGQSEKQLIKRVIGLPGDRVVVDSGVVTIYNSEHPRGYLVDLEGPQSETISSTPGNTDQAVKEGELFVMGDNRENSLDSRSFGTITHDAIVGRMAARIYPFNKADKF